LSRGPDRQIGLPFHRIVSWCVYRPPQALLTWMVWQRLPVSMLCFQAAPFSYLIVVKELPKKLIFALMTPPFFFIWTRWPSFVSRPSHLFIGVGDGRVSSFLTSSLLADFFVSVTHRCPKTPSLHSVLSFPQPISRTIGPAFEPCGTSPLLVPSSTETLYSIYRNMDQDEGLPPHFPPLHWKNSASFNSPSRLFFQERTIFSACSIALTYRPLED